MRSRRSIAVVAALLLTGCGATAPPGALRGAVAGYLLGIDQLVSPDFVTDAAPHAVNAGGVAAVTGATAAQLGGAGCSSAAAVDYFREQADVTVLNGPVQVSDTVVECLSVVGAASLFAIAAHHVGTEPGAVAISTGALGDQAHAVTRRATGPDGVALVQITVVWRVDDLVDVLVVRGRDGGVRPDDAFLLAHRQTVAELGLATPVPSATPASTAP